MVKHRTSSSRRVHATRWPASLAKLSKSLSDPASVESTSNTPPDGTSRKARLAISRGMGQRSPRASTDSVWMDWSGISCDPTKRPASISLIASKGVQAPNFYIEGALVAGRQVS